MKIALPLCVIAAASAAHAGELPGPEQYKFRIEYQEWRPDLSAEIRSGTLGTRLDLKDDLGIVDERTFEVRGGLQLLPGFKIRGSVTPIEYSADLRIDRSFVFNGRAYPVSAQVLSNVSGELYSAHLEFDLLKTPVGYLGVMIGGELFDGSASIAAPQFGLLEAEELNTPVPVVGATGRFYAGRLSLEGELSGLTIGDRGHSYEVRLGARFHIVERIAVGLGYRFFKIEGQDDPDFIDFRQGGLTFGAELSL
jgi:hypothetical protein